MSTLCPKNRLTFAFFVSDLKLSHRQTYNDISKQAFFVSETCKSALEMLRNHNIRDFKQAESRNKISLMKR